MRHRLALLAALTVIVDTATKTLAWQTDIARPLKVNGGVGSPLIVFSWPESWKPGLQAFWTDLPIWADPLIALALAAGLVLIIGRRWTGQLAHVSTGLTLIGSGWLSHSLERAFLYRATNSWSAAPPRGVTDWISLGGFLDKGPINTGDICIVLGTFILVCSALRATQKLLERPTRRFAPETA